VVVRALLPIYSPEWISRLWSELGSQIRDDVVSEYNKRLKLGLCLRYEPADDVGDKIVGKTQVGDHDVFSMFQSALLQLTDSEFELLAARLLNWAGCTDVWATPASHDEGLDAFGHMPLIHLPVTDDEKHPSVVMLIQAKHYLKSKVHTHEVRELVGSSELAKYKIYSTADEKYTQLETQPLVPLALFLVTSGEVTRDTRGLARRAGIFLLTSYDLFLLFTREWTKLGMTVGAIGTMRKAIRQQLKDIPVAR
jgi:hypothetical protein